MGRLPLALPPLDGIDLLILGGDLTHFGGRHRAGEILKAISDRVPQMLAVCGNCDLPEVEELLRQANLDLDGRSRELLGVRWMGLSGALPFDGCPYERDEQNYAKLLEPLQVHGPTVMVSHQPPYQTRCDRIRTGEHVGSHSLRAWIEGQQPDLVLCGHIHESYGHDTLGRTGIYNPGPWLSGRALRFQVEQPEDGPARLSQPQLEHYPL